MLRKRIDFTKPGGYPLTQDTLDYLQQSYTEVMLALSKVGNITVGSNEPIIIYGLKRNPDNDGTVIPEGWFIYNSDLIYFAGINTTTSPTQYLLIQETATPLTFNNGSTPNVVYIKEAVPVSTGSGGISTTQIPVNGSVTFISFQEKFGAAARTSETHIVVNTGSGKITGDLYWSIDRLNNMVKIRGTLTLQNALASSVYTLGTISALPAHNAPFTAVFDPSGSLTQDSTGIDWEVSAQLFVDTSGNIKLIFIEPVSTILFNINTKIPLD